MSPDSELIRAFVETGAQPAFAELVRRHVHWVNSMSRRLVRDPGLADDVTQAVFVLLARKARSLRHQVTLSTWLFTVTRLCASTTLRSEMRRKKHERQAAAMRSAIQSIDPSQVWQQLQPLLDEAVGQLNSSDRQAVLLRFYQQMSFGQIGQTLAISEEAARKRVARSIDKLREILQQRGVAASAVALAASLSANLTGQASAAVVAGATAAPTFVGVSVVQTVAAKMVWLSFKPVVMTLALIGTITVMTAALLQPVQSAPKAAGPATSPSTMPGANGPLRYGRLLSMDDKPIAGARVWGIEWSEALNRQIVTASVISDADGRFAVPSHRSAFIFVAAEGFAYGGGVVRNRYPDDPTEIRLRPPSTLRVQFVDSDDKPLAGVKVALAGCGESRNGWSNEILPELGDAQTRTTDEQGTCTFKNIPRGGIAWFDMRDPRYARIPFADWITLSDDPSFDGGTIKVAPAASISGKVSFADGKPAAGIRLMATAPRSGQIEATTDDQGRYSMPQLQAGEYCVFLFLTSEMMTQFNAVAIENLRIAPNVHLSDQNFTLIPGGIIRGRITEAATGEPLANHSVDVNGPSRPDQTHTIQVAKSDENGYYVMHLPPGKHRVQYFDPPPTYFGNEAGKFVEIADGQTVEINYQVQRHPFLSVKGRTVDAGGQPLGGVEIYSQDGREPPPQISDANTVSEPDGSFEIPVLTGSAVLRARKGKLTTLEPVRAAEQVTLTLHANALASHRVTINDPAGKPLTGIKVRLEANDYHFRERTTGADGVSLFESIAPDLPYSITTSSDQYELVDVPVAIEPGKQTESTLTLRKADSFIAGMVIDENGEPVAGVDVIATNNKYAWQAKTDISGRFHLEKIVPGETRGVSAEDQKSNRRSDPQSVVAGTDNVVLTLKPSAP